MNRKPLETNASLTRMIFAVAFLLLLHLTVSAPADAQKKKKKDDAQQQQQPSPAAMLPDEQKIDYAIGQMLAAWQLGDTTTMHKFYAEDVVVVAGTWTPPAIGWTNYVSAYDMQRARMQQVRMERSNTLIRVAPGNMVAWASYQWEFGALVDGAPSAAEGQTTLVFEKRGDNWLIVHNHTSLVQASQPVTPASPAPQPSAPAAAKP